MASEDVIRAWIVERLTLSIDNDEARLDEVQEAARCAVANDMSSVVTLQEYRQMHDGRGGAPYDRRDYEDAVGAAVSEVIGEWMETLVDDFLRTMLTDVLDLTDRSQRLMFGAHYLPDPDDMADHLDDEDDTEDEDED